MRTTVSGAVRATSPAIPSVVRAILRREGFASLITERHQGVYVKRGVECVSVRIHIFDESKARPAREKVVRILTKAGYGVHATFSPWVIAVTDTDAPPAWLTGLREDFQAFFAENRT